MFDPNRRAGPLTQFLWDLSTMPALNRQYMANKDSVLMAYGLDPNTYKKAIDDALPQVWLADAREPGAEAPAVARNDALVKLLRSEWKSLVTQFGKADCIGCWLVDWADDSL